MKYTMRSTIAEIAASEKGRVLLQRYANYDRMMQDFAQTRLKTLAGLAIQPAFGLDAAKVVALIEALNRPVEEIIPEVAKRQSLDARDRATFGAGPAPLEGDAEVVALTKLQRKQETTAVQHRLDGIWELVDGGTDAMRLNGDWSGSIPVTVPGSVHTALVRAGRIPDPTVGCNQTIAREESFKTWWYRTRFTCDIPVSQARLQFDGVCNVCYIWLNGTLLGRHEGMFGGPEYDVTSLLQQENTLIVKLEPIPFESWDMAGESGMPNTTPNPRNNGSWRETVVFNNVYGWHYSNLQSLGIWRSVTLVSVPDVELKDPFVATLDAGTGKVGLLVDLRSRAETTGELSVRFVPDNFEGETYGFVQQLQLPTGKSLKRYLFHLPEAKLWWPNDMGDQNLYRVEICFQPAQGTGDSAELLFGLRTVTMAPLPEGPSPYLYNWTFVINGQKRFVKGTGWCTMDPLMDFSRARYATFLSLAKAQHNQMLRAWGSGMPETEVFYELCARYGLMVLQEWPTAWDSHLIQPYDVMEETIQRNTLRLRNQPALVMWGAGNESPNPFGAEIDMMGRLSVELDGTRPFHRGEGWGGSTHDYTCYWGQESLQYNMTLTSAFFGEFGLASTPCLESMQRYLPEDEWLSPPPECGRCFTYHTPIFGTGGDLERLSQYAGYFLPETYNMEQFVRASQVAQTTGLRHPLERARVRWPECAGALFYKLNDNFPACSWACVDWYGAPKLSYYLVQDSFAPLQAVVLTDKLNMRGTPGVFQVFILDDSDTLDGAEWEVRVAAYRSGLSLVKEARFHGLGGIDAPYLAGELRLSYRDTDTAPLFVTSEVWKNGALAATTFYWYNFENNKGCLFDLPRTTLEWSVEGNHIEITNIGSTPAVGVEISCPGHQDCFRVSDNIFWLSPKATRSISVSRIDGLRVTAWNAP